MPTQPPDHLRNHATPDEPTAQDAAECLQLALDTGAIVGAWVWDIAADRFSADERFARTFGLSPQVCAQGLPLEQAMASVHPQDRSRVEAAVFETLGNGGHYRCEYRVLQSDASYRWIEANGHVEFDEAGRPHRFPGVLLDIQKRRSAEAERDRMTHLLRTFTAAVPGVVYAKDRQGRMLVANRGTTELIGKPPEQYIGRTDLEFLEDKVQAQVIMETDRRIMEGRHTQEVEEEVRQADGTAATWLSLKTPLLDEDGEVIGLIGSSIDVTARKKAEAAVRELNQTLEERVRIAIAEREKAEAALHQAQKMEAVGQLTGGIAHDFNNLLAGLSGSLELMHMRLRQGRTDDLERYLNVAQGAVKRAASLTHRLLAFSRRQTLAPVPTDVNALINGLEELVRRSVGPSIEVSVRDTQDLWTALIDPAQLENALLNLCINARDAMPAGGRITIETANQWLLHSEAFNHEVQAGEYLVVQVTDNGSGMSDEVMAKVFEPFFTTKPVGEGTGLGLSMIYGFARQSGGLVKIQSRPGLGTTVSLYLPRHCAGLEAQPVVSTQVPIDTGGSGETVLVVDDEASVRGFVAELLESLGYVVLQAGDSAQGQDLLQSAARIDLLVTDVGLPGGLNGRQMAELGRSVRPGLPVLYITGYAQNLALDQCHLQPCTEVLTKPFGLETLSEHVRTLLTAGQA